MTGLMALQGLTLAYEGATVLRDVDFAIEPGEIVTLVGPNGSGKSSFVKALIGALRPAAGIVSRRAGLRLGYVPQKLHLDATMPLTVQRFMGIPHRVTRANAEAALSEVDLAGFGKRQMTALSGGQLQRVLLAKALLAEPELLILDEPTQGLDQPGIAAFYVLLAAFRERTGCAVLLVSHDLHVVMSASDRVICLNGHVCCEGTPEIVSAAPAYRALFGDGTRGALALYRHDHDHMHDHAHNGAQTGAHTHAYAPDSTA